MSCEQTSPAPLNAGHRQTLRRCIGVGVIAVLALSLLWMAAHFVPGDPRAPQKKETPTGMTISFGLYGEADQVVDVPYGEVAVLDSLTRGERYELDASPYLLEQWERETEDYRRAVMAEDYWDYEEPAFSVQVTGCHLLTEEAFTAWYPHYPDASIMEERYDEEDVRIVVVELRAENLTDEAQCPPRPVLRHNQLVGQRDWLNWGMWGSDSVIAAMHGMAMDDSPNSLWEELGGWDVVEPGAAETIRYGYLLYRNSFTDPQAIDHLRLSDMDIAYFDWSPREIIALQLADA